MNSGSFINLKGNIILKLLLSLSIFFFDISCFCLTGSQSVSIWNVSILSSYLVSLVRLCRCFFLLFFFFESNTNWRKFCYRNRSDCSNRYRQTPETDVHIHFPGMFVRKLPFSIRNQTVSAWSQLPRLHKQTWREKTRQAEGMCSPL